jgi:hypothetical protein
VWSATAEVQEFDSAVEWFKARLPVTTEKLSTMGDKGRDRAFWITGVAQLDVVADVHKSILDAIKKGTPFEEWQKAIGPKLTEAWGKRNAYKAETVYRNCTQQSYIAGRLAQLRDPAVLKLRPFWKYIAIDDGRCPTGICPLCNGVILEPDQPWWSGHTPQLHHACRCRIDSLMKETAKEQGGATEVPPVDMPPEGWGKPPDLQSTEEWKKPVEKRIREKVHPELVKEFERKQVRDKPKAPPKPKTNPDHDPKRWEPFFKEQGYSETSAKALAWGRAMQERGLDMSPKDVITALKPFSETQSYTSNGFSFAEELLSKTKAKTVRECLKLPGHGEDAQNNVISAAAMAAHANALGPVRMTCRVSVPADEIPADIHVSIDNTPTGPTSGVAATKAASAFYAVFADKQYSFRNAEIEFNGGNATEHPDRAYYDWAGEGNRRHIKNWINGGDSGSARTVVHELGHCLEEKNQVALVRAKTFYEDRTKGEELAPMGEGFGPDEVTRKDKFFSPYMGKYYYGQATELSSMINDLMFGSNRWKLFAADPHSFWWGLGNLANVH